MRRAQLSFVYVHTARCGVSCQRLWPVRFASSSSLRHLRQSARWGPATCRWRQTTGKKMHNSVRAQSGERQSGLKLVQKKMARSKKKKRKKVREGSLVGWWHCCRPISCSNATSKKYHDHFVRWIWGENLFLLGRLAASRPRPLPSLRPLGRPRGRPREKERERGCHWLYAGPILAPGCNAARCGASRSLLALQLGRLLDGAVLVEQLQHLVLVVQDLHHSVPGLRHLVHHQLAALHVALRTKEGRKNSKKVSGGQRREIKRAK